MNKAFTLIELIAVMAILGILIAIALPMVINSRDEAKNKAYEIAINNIEKVAYLYVTENIGEFSNGSSFELDLEDLCSAQYIECPVYNPDTKEEINGYIEITKNADNSFNYKFHAGTP